MARMLKRRQFLQGAAGASVAASIGFSNLKAYAGRPRKPQQSSESEHVQAVVIGSGFGGGVASLRLGQAEIETVVLERGRRWTITDEGNTFSPYDQPDGRAAFLSPTTLAFGPPTPIDIFTGLLTGKVSTDNSVAALSAAGVGGTSLIYGGITYQPSRRLFYKIFPTSIDYSELDEVYFPRVRSVLGATPIPDDILQTPFFLSTRLFKEQAENAGFTTRKIDIAFDWDIVRAELRGEKVPSIITGQYYYGAESGAKNSVDRNYLKMAEETGYVEIRPLHVVTTIQALKNGHYRIDYAQINEQGEPLAQRSIICRYLFLAAGSIGTTDLLLKAKAEGTLPRLRNSVGRFWGTNADSITVMINNQQTNPTFGTPGIIALEDLRNPISPVVMEPFPFPGLPQGVINVLGQGLSRPEGQLRYNPTTQTSDLTWPADSNKNQRVARAVQRTFDQLNQANGTSLATPPSFTNTAHPLGGAIIGRVCNTYGEVFGYQNMLVVDGAMIPGSTACVNPSLTIAALAERSLDHFLNTRAGG